MSKVKFIIGLIMVFLYLGIGTFSLLVNQNRLNSNPTGIRIFGAVAVLYGCFRAFRVYQIYKANKNEDENEE